MGRRVQTEPPVDVGFIRQSFTVGDGGALQRRVAVTNSAEDPVYDNGGGALRVRLTFAGKRRTLDAARVAWALHFGAWPRGQVITLGAQSDFSPGNLKIAPRLEHKPHAAGGRASSLIRRQAADRTLIAAMAGHPGAQVEELGKLVGSSKARTSTRLTKLAEQGLTVSPMCVPGRSWCLSGAGRDAAIGMSPLLDDLDRDILAVLRSAAMGPVRLGRRVGCCELTIRRRAKMLEAKGLLIRDPRRFYQIATAGIAMVGDIPKPWIRPEAVSAAMSREVVEREGKTAIDDRTSWDKSAHAKGKLLMLEGGKAKMGRPPSAWNEKRLTSERAKASG